ncbi:phage tail protein [Paenibacillus lutimineralis]|uniref:Prophage tail endopeptidase domain-containing protein n=1 Tax=Paenibacillus lutimineralis TaxID=2707005 RepID=A0A3S9V4B1_9BACL|nr:phage tail protein [Paenibacillus lutimineralis]AZS17382.1 hypothetical protein EI981_25150 [Paenibacillus lutimineralis]
MQPNPTMEAFDKDFKRLGTLIDAYQIERRRRLNSDNELSFLVPMTSDDYLEKLQLKGHVMDERGQYYVINTRQRQRTKKQLTALITCTHVMYKMNDYKVPYDDYITEAYGVHISTLLNKISGWTGGRFTFQVHDTFDLWDIKDFGRTTALAALTQVLNTYKAEVRPDNFIIHIYKKTGADDRFEFRTKKNIIRDSFKDDTTNLVTRMYAYMKDGVTFRGLPISHLTSEELSLLQSIPGAIKDGKIAVNYLLSPYVNYWGSQSVPYFDGENIQQDITDPIELLKSTRDELRKKEMPELDITVEAADLHKIDRDEHPPDLGDAATVFDPEMDMHRIAVRIVELTEYPYSMDQQTKVTLANFALKDDIDLIADLERSRKVMDNLLSGGRIRTEVFETFARQAVIDVHNSKTEVIYDSRGIILQSRVDPLGQVIMTADGIIFSQDGGKTANTAINHKGIAAPAIVGQLGSFVSMLIGSGNDVTQINTKGIAAGHADFNQAPFQVDMKGNVLANKLTANYAQIKSSNFKDGAIVGSSINVGNGKFTVSSAGEMYVEGGVYVGGTITGALLRTAVSGARIEINSSGLRAFDSSGYERIGITPANTGGGMGSINFKTAGSLTGYLASGSGLVQLVSNGRLFIASLDSNIQIQGKAYFYDHVQFGGGISGIAISHIEGLQAQLNSIIYKLDGLPGSSQTATNMSFDPNTRNLKLYSVTGGTLATVNIPK